MTPFMLSKDDIELQFATNHIGMICWSMRPFSASDLVEALESKILLIPCHLFQWF